MENERMKRGIDRLKAVDGDHGIHVIESLAEIAPDLRRYILEFAFGEHLLPERAFPA